MERSPYPAAADEMASGVEDIDETGARAPRLRLESAEESNEGFYLRIREFGFEPGHFAPDALRDDLSDTGIALLEAVEVWALVSARVFAMAMGAVAAKEGSPLLGRACFWSNRCRAAIRIRRGVGCFPGQTGVSQGGERQRDRPAPGPSPARPGKVNNKGITHWDHAQRLERIPKPRASQRLRVGFHSGRS